MVLKYDGKEFTDDKAFKAYVRQQEAESKAQWDIAAAHSEENKTRYPTKRPAGIPERRTDNLLIGEKLYYGDVVQSRFISGKTEWLNWMTPNPAKKFTLILERTKTETCDAPIQGYQKITEEITRREYCFVLEGEPLQSNAWLNPSDVTEICPFYVMFVNGFRHATSPSATASCKEVESFTPIRTSNIIPAAAPAAPTPPPPRINNTWTKQEQQYVASKWKAYRDHNGTRQLDCYEAHKNKSDFPERFKSVEDFQKCLESARKSGLMPPMHTKRRKNAGK